MDCLLDSGAQLNLARHLEIPPFYWDKSNEGGSTINGSLFPIEHQVLYFRLQIQEHPVQCTFLELDEIPANVILSSEFFTRWSPIQIDYPK